MNRDAIRRLTGRQKLVLAIASDCLILPGALWIALVLRHGHWSFDILPFWPGFAVTLACIPVFAHLGLYRHVMRYLGPAVIWTLVKGIVLTAVALTALAYMVRLEDFPRSIPVIFALLAFCGTAGTPSGIHRRQPTGNRPHRPWARGVPDHRSGGAGREPRHRPGARRRRLRLRRRPSANHREA